MSALWLTVKVAPGTDIDDACAEAVALADRLLMTIWFDFNGVKCLARYGDNPARIAEEWLETMKAKNKRYKIAADNSDRTRSGPDIPQPRR